MPIRCCILALAIFISLQGTALARVDTLSLYIEAIMTRDTATLEKILAENYLHINGNGYLQDKENFIASIKSGKMRIDRMSVTNIKESSYGGATLTTGNVILHGKFTPKLPEGLQRMSIVLERKGDTEKVLLFQATPVKPSAEKAATEKPATEKAASKKK